MKVALFIPSLEAGGAERQLVQLANGLTSRGHQVHVVLFRLSGSLVSDLHGKVNLHDLEKGGKWDVLGFLVRALRFFKKQEVDVIYSFLGVPNLVTALLKPFLGGVPVIWSVRASDMDLRQYSLLSRLCWRMECGLSFVPDCVIANSTAGFDFAKSQGYRPRNELVIPNGIDTERFIADRRLGESIREEVGCRSDDILVGLVARLDPMKDHRMFLGAARIVADHDKRVRFACVGGGSLEGELHRMTGEYGLGGIVKWLGERNDMQAVYNAMDVCCLSSAFGEGFPNVVGEAMSCGIPCVVTDVGDAALIVGKSGVVVPKGDSQTLADGLLEMVGRIRRGQAEDPRGRIEAVFRVEKMVERTERIMAEVSG